MQTISADLNNSLVMLTIGGQKALTNPLCPGLLIAVDWLRFLPLVLGRFGHLDRHLPDALRDR